MANGTADDLNDGDYYIYTDDDFQQEEDTMPQPGEPDTGDLEEPEEIKPLRRVLTIEFSRTMRPREYESAGARASMQVDLPDGTTLDEALALYAREMAQVKASVLSQLDLPFKIVDKDTPMMRILETFEESTTLPAPQAAAPTQAPPQGAVLAPGGQAPAAPQQTFTPPPGPAPATAPGSPGASAPAPAGAVVKNRQTNPRDMPAWQTVVAELSSGGAKSFFDNRFDKRSPKAPDFKQKTKQGEQGWSLWLNSCPDEYMEFFGVVQG